MVISEATDAPAAAEVPDVVRRRTVCRCGHPEFPERRWTGHFRNRADSMAVRHGPCGDCSCTKFNLVELEEEQLA